MVFNSGLVSNRELKVKKMDQMYSWTSTRFLEISCFGKVRELAYVVGGVGAGDRFAFVLGCEVIEEIVKMDD